MPDGLETRRNFDPWRGLLLAFGALLCNAAFFLNPPAQRAIPWLSLLLALAALLFLARGVQRAFGQSHIYRGKISSSILTIFALLVVGASVFTFFHARALPVSGGVPRVGQTVPDFTLADTSGKPVTLAQLFAPAADGAQPKMALLIFYRGYW